MLDEVQAWLHRRTSRTADWSVDRLVERKAGHRVSVVLPARDEAATIGAIVTTIRRALVERTGLVDEVLVVDSRSRDATAEVAAAAGATVVHQDAVLGHLPPAHGKGEALWKGLAASSGDIVVAIDADLRDLEPAFVTGLLGPLLDDEAVSFVKGFYHRPLVGDAGVDVDGGGRVSELVARPLLNIAWPQLAGFVQPLAGEFAARRALLETVPFTTGYGVEIGMLVDVLERAGLDAMAQVDLGHRVHRHHDLQALGRMSTQIHLAAAARLARSGRLAGPVARGTTMVQFRRASSAGDGGLDREIVETDVAVDERPPLRDVLVVPVPRGERSVAG
jgi:glucosyl-3-phosphoglycerate synthase